MTTSTVLSTPTLYSTFGGDPDFGELVELFVNEMPRRLATLEQAFATGDQEELRRVAHQIRGAAGSYGFHQVTPFAARLEAALVDKQPEAEIHAAFEELIQVCHRLRAGAAT